MSRRLFLLAALAFGLWPGEYTHARAASWKKVRIVNQTSYTVCLTVEINGVVVYRNTRFPGNCSVDLSFYTSASSCLVTAAMGNYSRSTRPSFGQTRYLQRDRPDLGRPFKWDR